jgi:hypothetical protein
MSRLFAVLMLLALCAAAAPARAMTPESGWWWNPDEPGYGVSIEIQDDFVFLAIYTYDSIGSPRQSKWYVAQGFLTGDDLFRAQFTTDPSASNVFYTSRNGTCLGCPFTPFQFDTTDNPGSIEVRFESETTARMTVGGRVIPIERHDFWLSRTPGVDPKTELWLGEWQVVLDFINIEDYEDYPFLGEVLIFDLLDTSDSPDFFEGCRPEDSLVGFCDDFALENHDASGFYSPADGTNIIVVNDSANGWFVYEVEVGTYQFDGYMKSCPKSLTNLLTQCLDNNADYPVIPVRGWRSASRAFIEGEDAPSAGGGVTKAGRLSSETAAAGEGRFFKAKAGVPAPQPRPRADAAATSALLDRAIERLETNRRSRR